MKSRLTSCQDYQNDDQNFKKKTEKLGPSRPVLVTKYFSGHQMKNNKTLGACSTYVGRERVMQGLVGRLRERDQLEDLGVDGNIISMWIFKK
jgi:hypothetical protein